MDKRGGVNIFKVNDKVIALQHYEDKCFRVATILKEPQFIGDMWYTNMGSLEESDMIKIPESLKERLISGEITGFALLEARDIARYAVYTSQTLSNKLCLRSETCKISLPQYFHPGAVVLHINSYGSLYKGLFFRLYTLKNKYYSASVDAWTDTNGNNWVTENLLALSEELLRHVKTSIKGNKTIHIKHILNHMNLQESRSSCSLCLH